MAAGGREDMSNGAKWRRGAARKEPVILPYLARLYSPVTKNSLPSYLPDVMALLPTVDELGGRKVGRNRTLFTA